MRCGVYVLLCMSVLMSPLHAEWIIDLEGGPAWNAYNDIRIPGDSGTLFSLTDDFQVQPAAFWRARLSYVTESGRHWFSLLAAPLRFHAAGITGTEVDFAGTTIPAGTEVSGRFRFDSYRFTWRYLWYPAANLTIGAGLTTKVRSASISLEGGGLKGVKDDLGIVPLLLNFSVRWWFVPRMNAVLEGDWLAVPQGRAADILAGLEYYLKPQWSLRLGYRFVEGGSDSDVVYNFSFIHYLVLGMEVGF